MTSAPQELVENQHADQVHLDEQTGAVTPIREFLAHEVARIKGVVEHEPVDVEKIKAEAEAEVEKARAEVAKLKAEVEKLKTKAADAPAVPPVVEAKPADVAKPATKTEKAAAAPAPTAVRETGDVK